MRKYLTIIILLIPLLFALPRHAAAVDWFPLVPCGLNVQPAGVTRKDTLPDGTQVPHDYTQPCNQCLLVELGKNVIDMTFFAIVPSVGTLMFMIAGFIILFNAREGKAGGVAKGKEIMTNTAIGIAIILGAWLITNFILKSIANDQVASTPWYQIQCRTDGIQGLLGLPPAPSAPQPPVIPPGGVLVVAIVSLPDAIQGTAYSQALSATGGTAPYTWTVSSGALPAGISISGNTISGTSTTAGTATFTIKVEDSSSPKKSATKDFTIKVVTQAVSIVISNVASSNVTANGATITWTTDKPSTSRVEYGTATSYGLFTPLNSSLVVNHSVVLTNLTPDINYNYRAISSVTGFTAQSSNNTFKTLAVAGATLTIATVLLPDAIQGTAYSQALSATGGTAPYTWTISSGTLPAGLTISGLNISGTPTATGTSTFTIKVEDSSSPKQSITKQLNIVVAETGALTCGASWETNLCQSRSMTCNASACNQYVPAVNEYAGRTGVTNGANFLKAIMIKESACNVGAQSGSVPPSCGLMQLKASTANMYKDRCNITANITCDWLKSPANASDSICIAAEYMRALTQTSCGSTPRGVAAGYNGGSGACNNSADCASQTSCAGGAVQRWECLYDNPQHKVCNTGYAETRDYVTKVLYCYNNPPPAPPPKASITLPSDFFTFVVIPDTQVYTDPAGYGADYSQSFKDITNWIKANFNSLKIKMVAHVGDVVDDSETPSEWKIATDAMGVLDGAGIPYGILAGNHDFDKPGTVERTRTFNDHFPASKFSGKSWWGGSMGSYNSNSYVLFSGGGENYVLISLRYNQDLTEDTVWANSIIKKYPSRKVIISTHAFLAVEGGYKPTEGGDFSNIWSDFVYNNSNVIMVVSGHDPGEAFRVDKDKAGKNVYQLLSDYQGYGKGGHGRLRKMTFALSQSKIYVQTLATSLDKTHCVDGTIGKKMVYRTDGCYETDSNSEFIIDLETGTMTPGPFELVLS